MPDIYNLQRFVYAQKNDYAVALSEIQNGRKRSHWMWYIFPQVQGLGFSEMSKHYAIKNSDEAKAYLAHPVLGKRLAEISNALLSLQANNATSVLGSPDDVKLKSCMTLFASLPDADGLFRKVLDKFFAGKEDKATLEKLRNAG